MSLGEQLHTVREQAATALPEHILQAFATFNHWLAHESGVLHQMKRPGDTAPHFALPDAVLDTPRGTGGTVHRLSDALQRGPAAVIFFRGKW